MKKFRELKEEVATPPIGVRSLYTKMYAKHGGTASKAKDAQSKAYAEVEKKHGKEMRNSLEAFHKKNMNEAVKDKFDIGEYDQEGDMAISDLRSILANAKRVHDMLEDDDNLPEWVQSKITKAEDYMSTVANYMEAEMNEEVEQIDELSKSTLASYAKKATHDSRMNMAIGKDFERVGANTRKPEYKAGAKKWEDKYKSDARRREAGTMKAIDRLAKEEVEELDEGRPSQRHPLEGHEYHRKSDAELVGIAKDAHKAAEAMKSHNTTAENKYRDQANDSATVRYFRKKSGMPDWYKKKYGHMKEEVELDEENKPTNPELWARAKSMAKSKFDVYPCVPLDSLAISKKGPIAHDELEIGDEILTFNMKEDKLEWKPVLHKHYYENAPLMEIGKPTGFSIRCTPNHKWVISRTNDMELVETKDLNTHMKIIMCSVLQNDSNLLIENWTKKDNWIEKVLSMNKKEREIFLASSVVYDGWDKGLSTKIKDRHTFGFVQKEYDHLWASLLSAYLNGYYVNTNEKSDITGATYIRNKKYHSTQNLYKKDAGSEDVWCPTTENETWVMIQNGLITITGNSAYANGWAAKWYKSKGGGWRSVNEENYEVTVMHTTKDGEKGEHTHKVMNADDSRHAKNIALQKHEKMLDNKGVEVRGMGTTTAKVVEEGSAYDRINARFKKLSGKSLEDTAKYHKAESEKLAKEIKDQEEKNKKMKSEAVKDDDLPFTPDKPKKKDIIAGKYGAGYSTAKSLAKQAMKKQMEKMKKPIKEEMSKKAKIVKNIMKNKNSDKFESDPIISKTVDDKES